MKGKARSKEVLCESCGHPAYYHKEGYGCEYEPGDCYERRGPCGCEALKVTPGYLVWFGVFISHNFTVFEAMRFALWMMAR